MTNIKFTKNNKTGTKESQESRKLQLNTINMPSTEPQHGIFFMIEFMHWNPKFDPHPRKDASHLEDIESLFQNCFVQGFHLNLNLLDWK